MGRERATLDNRSLQENPWALAVGTFVLAFGDIEHLTISLLTFLPECKIPKTAPHLDLKRRFEVLEEILSRHEEEDYKAVLTTMKRAESLLSERNLLAHNGLTFDFFLEDGKLTILPSIASARNRKKSLRLEQVEALASDARRLAVDFSAAAIELMRRWAPESERN